MPRLRSQTRITSVLPRELLQRSLEFLPVREVYCEAQLISSEFLSASRRALTRGRWRPMARFSDEAEEHRNRFEYGADLSSWHETFKEVWALEPGEVFLELAISIRIMIMAMLFHISLGVMIRQNDTTWSFVCIAFGIPPWLRKIRP